MFAFRFREKASVNKAGCYRKTFGHTKIYALVCHVKQKEKPFRYRMIMLNEQLIKNGLKCNIVERFLRMNPSLNVLKHAQ